LLRFPAHTFNYVGGNCSSSSTVTCPRFHRIAWIHYRRWCHTNPRHPDEFAFRYKSSGINQTQWIPCCICVWVGSSCQPNRIRLRVPANGRIVIPIDVVVQPTLGIKVLPREPEVEGGLLPIPIRVFKGRGAAKRIAAPGPHDLAGLICGFARRVERVGLQVHHLVLGAGVAGCVGAVDHGRVGMSSFHT